MLSMFVLREDAMSVGRMSAINTHAVTRAKVRARIFRVDMN
jgi:hypothetical protein